MKERQMESKEVNYFRNSKPHQDKETLAALFSEGLNSLEISKKLHVSTKLVEIMRKQFGLRA
jgi:serine kinase of HPr protein (carbohydrate metabolism regulator)